MENLTSSEALYGFVSWLSVRDETVKIGAKEDGSILPSLLEKFERANKLPQVREGWADNLIHPD